MIYTTVLLLHVAVGFATFALVGASAYALTNEKSAWFKKLSASIGACAALETASGFALAALSPDLSPARVGLHLLFYLTLCLIAEAALIFNSRRVWIG
ncbi:MAG TPA: hypothetical protein VN701_00010 [Candidatus Paceibacterota bacterium]|nr:hypothetical protein [Candidatus Paceibacterota bacterium]